MGTDMAAMASTASNKRILLMVCLTSTVAWGGDWKITPGVALSERYSDNVNLDAAGLEQADWITEITPRIAVARNGARLKVNADYGLQGLLYAKDSDRNDVRHNLNGRANAELVEDWFFLDATARVSQQLIDLADAGGLGDAVGIGNTNTVGAYSLAPYIKHRFGSAVTVEARLAHEGVFISDSPVSDTESNRYTLSVVSGSRFIPFTWAANYNRTDTNNSNAVDSGSELFSANARYQLRRSFGLLAQASMEKNDFTGANANVRDYSSYGLGVFYTPGRRVSMDVLYNVSDDSNFLSGSLTLNPTLRTALQATTSKRAFGRSYALNLTHRTRKSNWSLRYQDDLTTSQQQFTNFDGYLCPAGILPPDPSCIPAISQPQSNETYLAKNLIGAVSYTLRRATWNLSLYNNRREYQASGATDTTQGVQTSFGLRPAAHTTFTLSGGLSRNESSGLLGLENDLWNISLAASHQFRTKVTGSLEVRHQDRQSNQASGDYAENSVAARLNMSF